MSNYKIPHSVLLVLKQLEAGGFQAYLVGGSVRDMIMGRSIHDWDITTDAPAEVTMSLFKRVIPTGIKYGTVTVLIRSTMAEVTTFRADGAYADSRHPEDVKFVKSLGEDLARRDFTINAMAMDASGNMTDLFGGKEDIENRLIRCVGAPEKRFSEDALRMLRAVRFSAQLGFEIEKSTMAAMKRLGGNVSELSAERVLEETVKILMSPRPEMLMLAFRCGMYKGRTEKMPDFDALKRINKIKKNKSLRLCALAYILGDTEFLVKLRADSKSIKLYKTVESIDCDTIQEIRYALAEHGEDAVSAACAVRDARYGGCRIRRMRNVRNSGTVITKDKLSITGNDLVEAGISKGPKIGTILSVLLRHVNDVPEDNRKDVLVKMALNMEF